MVRLRSVRRSQSRIEAEGNLEQPAIEASTSASGAWIGCARGGDSDEDVVWVTRIGALLTHPWV